MNDQNNITPQTGAQPPIEPAQQPATNAPEITMSTAPAVTLPAGTPTPPVAPEMPSISPDEAPAMPSTSPVEPAAIESVAPPSTTATPGPELATSFAAEAMTQPTTPTEVPSMTSFGPTTPTQPLEPAAPLTPVLSTSAGPTGEVMASMPQQAPQSALPAKGKKKSKMLVLLLAGIGVLLVVALAAVMFMGKSKATPQSVFDKALVNAWKTGTEVITVDGNTELGDGTVTMSYDLNDAKNPKLLAHMDGSVSGTELAADFTYQSGAAYMRYTKLSVPELSKADFTPLLNKWIKIPSEKDATDESLMLTSKEELSDMFLGEWIVGKFTAAQQKELLSLVQNKKVYEVTSKSLVSQTVDGTDMYVLDVTTGHDAVVEMGKKAASFLGITTSSKFRDVIEDAKPAVKLYINKKTNKLAQVEYTNASGKKETQHFSKYDEPVMMDTASEQITEKEFTEKMTAIAIQAAR